MNSLLKKNGYIVKKIKNKNLLDPFKKIIKKHFNKTNKYYSKISLKKFHQIAIKCQNEINNTNFNYEFYKSEKSFLKKMFKNDKVMISSVITLRAVRPNTSNTQEVEQIGWHRETFYGKNTYIKHAMNIWFPLINVSKRSYLSIIPKSHLIEDKKIKRRVLIPKNYSVKKFSNAHKLGFPYAPKKIISGVNLNKPKRVKVNKNSYIIFSQLLIHGNSVNNTNSLRFAMNTGIVPASKLRKNRIVDKRKFRLNNKKNKLYELFN